MLEKLVRRGHQELVLSGKTFSHLQELQVKWRVGEIILGRGRGSAADADGGQMESILFLQVEDRTSFCRCPCHLLKDLGTKGSRAPLSSVDRQPLI